ncbi:hypothetical protein [Oerskovia enterophila]|uniref:Uncharacterized protein n=1 Tax=Oerskovia enterophila TaxID=43678 RepID=A0ABX2Y988_9CELL|nr:hypothetical protein [Oerskovia enterophila]OCI32782.1 hypothetical protein OERS_03740 [Oerskovia enterophila]
MSRYAESTGVPSDRSRSEIERTLRRYGATTFTYGWTEGRAAIGFVKDGRQIRFVLPLPARDDRAFTHTPARGTPRTEAEIEKQYEQAVRQRWRALALMVKAKLEAVDAGIVTFEAEFLPHTVLPSGRTVFEDIGPSIDLAYRSGQVAPLQIEGLR